MVSSSPLPLLTWIQITLSELSAEGGEWTGNNWYCHCIVSLWVCYDPGHVFPVTVLLSQCWLVPRYPSTGHWVPVRLGRPPTVALAGRGWLLTLTLTQARGAVTWVDPGLTQWSPSHCYDGTVSARTERQLWLWVNVKPKLVNTVIVLCQLLTCDCNHFHCPWSCH